MGVLSSARHLLNIKIKTYRNLSPFRRNLQKQKPDGQYKAATKIPRCRVPARQTWSGLVSSVRWATFRSATATQKSTQSPRVSTKPLAKANKCYPTEVKREAETRPVILIASI